MDGEDVSGPEVRDHIVEVAVMEAAAATRAGLEVECWSH